VLHAAECVWLKVDCLDWLCGNRQSGVAGNREIGEAKLLEMFNFCVYVVMFICHKASIMLETRSKAMKLTGRSPLRR